MAALHVRRLAREDAPVEIAQALRNRKLRERGVPPAARKDNAPEEFVETARVEEVETLLRRDAGTTLVLKPGVARGPPEEREKAAGDGTVLDAHGRAAAWQERERLWRGRLVFARSAAQRADDVVQNLGVETARREAARDRAASVFIGQRDLPQNVLEAQFAAIRNGGGAGAENPAPDARVERRGDLGAPAAEEPVAERGAAVGAITDQWGEVGFDKDYAPLITKELADKIRERIVAVAQQVERSVSTKLPRSSSPRARNALPMMRATVVLPVPGLPVNTKL